jgi:methionyl-tRNA formyltransferase
MLGEFTLKFECALDISFDIFGVMKPKATAVVFAYHDVGVRCLKALVQKGIDVKLVVTHNNSPTENIWFESVQETAKNLGLKVTTPDNPNSAEFVNELKAEAPDFIFSFYYRHMLTPDVLKVAKHNCFNIHGSLLPKYRGRVPINWAIVKGESETGATLHLMTEKPDAGDIVDQMSVPILANDIAFQVFSKVVDAAEKILLRSIDSIVRGDFARKKNDLKAGSYFGGRKLEDGAIELKQRTQEIYNLIRAVAPPYPGAYIEISADKRLFIYQARPSDVVFLENEESSLTEGALVRPIIFESKNKYYLQVEKQKSLCILQCSFANSKPEAALVFFNREFSKAGLSLPLYLRN